MSAPKRIQRKRTKGWRMPEGAVYVGRPSRWGNPYDWRSYPAFVQWDGDVDHVPEATRKQWAVIDFKSVCVHEIGSFQYPSRDEIRRELAGHDLACWCPLDQPCHADVLLEIANRPTSDLADDWPVIWTCRACGIDHRFDDDDRCECGRLREGRVA